MKAVPAVQALYLCALCCLPLALSQSCTVGGSTRYYGYSNGSISGGGSTPRSCNPNFCCSRSDYCGPEPTIPNTEARSQYCGTGCQSAYGNCNPGPSYFEYIGVGNCGAACPSPRVNTQAVINSIPTPRSGAPLYFIVFLITDQQQVNGRGSGTSTGQFRPTGLFAENINGQLQWDPAKIRLLSARQNTKVMASIVGDAAATQWQGVPDVNAYVTAATSSLRSYRSNYGLAGFDINYEVGITGTGTAQTQWLQAWCQIINNLKQDGALITFAPYRATAAAYKSLQQCLSDQRNTNIDFIIYQSYAEDASASAVTASLQSAQQNFAPTKIVAGVANSQLGIPNFVTSVIQPLLSSGTITGISVFSADVSSAAQPPYRLENALWNS